MISSPTLEEPTASERAREVLAQTHHADGCRVLTTRRGTLSKYTCDRVVRAMLAFTQPTPPASLDVRERAQECLARHVEQRDQHTAKLIREHLPAPCVSVNDYTDAMIAFANQERAMPVANGVEAVIRQAKENVLGRAVKAGGAYSIEEMMREAIVLSRATPDAGDAL